VIDKPGIATVIMIALPIRISMMVDVDDEDRVLKKRRNTVQRMVSLSVRTDR
jgi:hypothetical protein